jgi:hypothetical protein
LQDVIDVIDVGRRAERWHLVPTWVNIAPLSSWHRFHPARVAAHLRCTKGGKGTAAAILP